MSNIAIEDNHIDDHVDVEIQNCFKNGTKQCFFMFAGAGSGKTKSLVSLLKYLKENTKEQLVVLSQQIAVITYTNVACDEILDRVDYDDIFQVQTIHSFLWECIRNLQIDIKQWIQKDLENEISELKVKYAKTRSTTSADKIIKRINSKEERLQKLEKIKRFSYNPNGQNLENDSLSHSQVLQIGCEFIRNKKTMQKILINKYPIILIDESQDTKKELVDALLEVYKNNKNVAIGMFGDQMQRIYTDGKENIEAEIPVEWVKPVKVMNHRSAKRIVELANKIREKVDDKQQIPRKDAKEGVVRLFVCDNNIDKYQTEKEIADKMLDITKDEEWNKNYQCLILEHHMAATRLNFEGFFNPIYEVESLRTGILDGSLTEITFFTKIILPLIENHQNGDKFNEMKILKRNSKLLYGKNISDAMEKLKIATNDLYKLWEENDDPLLIDILKKIQDNDLIELPERLKGVLQDEEEEEIQKLKQALNQPFSKLIAYNNYINGESGFGTQQGIKGLEFMRVMVILDDKNSKGFLFSYEKLFGVKEKSETDIRNEQAKKDTSISRTNRLFYVACTRAKESLAVVVYTENVEQVKRKAIENNWFKEEEIEIMGM